MTDEAAAFLGGCTTKSGVPLDRNEIDKIILEASKGSKFYEHQQRRELRVSSKVHLLRQKKEQLAKDSLLMQKAEVETRAYLSKLESRRNLGSTFVHVDMDAFFAAVETLKKPELATIPMAVGGESMLCTANYEARKFGVVSAMPGYIARKLCPQLVILKPDSESYREAGRQVRQVFQLYDPNFASHSLDEASLDLTTYLLGNPDETADQVVARMRCQVYEKTRLTCSAGIAVNRKLAKLCSNVNKPNGQFTLPADREAICQFMLSQKIKKINGVGKVSAKILVDLLGIETCSDLLANASWIRLLFSESHSEFLLRSCLGIEGLPGDDTNEERKSMSVERTFKTIKSLSEMDQVLRRLCQELADDLEEKGLAGKTVGIKMKTSNFDTLTRAVTLHNHIYREEEIYRHATKILIKHHPADLRLLGVRLSSLTKVQVVESEIRFRSLDDFANLNTSTESLHRPECPVCGSPIHVHPDDLVRINEHIDQCIKKTERVEVSKNTSAQRKSVRSNHGNLDKFLVNKHCKS